MCSRRRRQVATSDLPILSPAPVDLYDRDAALSTWVPFLAQSKIPDK